MLRPDRSWISRGLIAIMLFVGLGSLPVTAGIWIVNRHFGETVVSLPN